MSYNIVQVSAECAPFSKTGGLADVVGALGPSLGRQGHRVITVTPRYGGISMDEVGATPCGNVGVVVGGHRQDVTFFRLDREHDTVVFVEHSMFGERKGIYGDQDGTFGDNHIRFTLLTRAAIEAARRVEIDGQPFGEDVIFHAHDWHTAILPIVLEASYRSVGLFQRAPVVLTVHNMAHQGRLPSSMFADLELAPRWMLPWGLEWHGDLCLLKGGLLHADAVTTVSPTFAREIARSPSGFGLESIIRHRGQGVRGILNGIDLDVWNPSVDPHLPANYDVGDMDGKAICKGNLQAQLGLPVDAEAPLIGSVGRLDPQKGIDLLIESIPWLVQMGAQVVILGSAAATYGYYETKLRALEQAYPRNVRAWIGFSEKVAHQIEAAADFFAMPSRFEPCGLNQMYSMRYGTVPVVRTTGGLADSVHTLNSGAELATGFRFDTFTGYAFRDALYQAIDTRKNNPDLFAQIVSNGMSTDWSWEARMAEYEAVYLEVADGRDLPSA